MSGSSSEAAAELAPLPLLAVDDSSELPASPSDSTWRGASVGTGVSAAVMTTAVVGGTVDVGITVVVDSASTTERNESSSRPLPSARPNIQGATPSGTSTIV